MRTHFAAVVRTGMAVVALIAVTAQPLASFTQPSARTRPADDAARAVRASTGIVVGSAWKGDATPYAAARIRLRNVETGRGIARTTANGEGRFRFEEVNPGVYVAELLAPDDKVLAVGDLFGVTAGNQSITVVRLSARTPWFGGFFGNAAAAAIAAASTLGVTATGSNGRPVSPQ